MKPVPVRLTLLGGFELACSGERVDLALSAQRVIVFLALHSAPLLRLYVAGVLWADAPEDRAAGSLRSALWRLKLCGHQLVEGSRTHLWLGPDVTVDHTELGDLYRRVLAESLPLDPGLCAPLIVGGELLPDWYDEWVLAERELFRQLRLHALEALSARFTSAGKYWLALETGMAAVAAEPLRESAHRAVVIAHLAEGNRSEALLQFRAYRDLLGREMGVQPSFSFAKLAGCDAEVTIDPAATA